jgi:DNA-binding beta-propeller fold protein YncE
MYGFGNSAFLPQDLGSFTLFTVDLKNGHSSSVWTATFPGAVTAIAFNRSGNLFVLETTPGNLGIDVTSLLQVDKKTGAVIGTAVLSHPLGFSAGVAFHPLTGVAYVADGNFHGTNNLYTLNTSTGQLTTIGPTGLAFRFGIASLAFDPK